jgi:Trk K+ transport system NAD-binding subunit
MSSSERSETREERSLDRQTTTRGDDSVSVDGSGETTGSTAHGTRAAADAQSTSTTVVGGGQVGRLIARRLLPDRPVRYVDDDRAAVERAAGQHEATYVRDLGDRDALAAAIDGDSVVVVATSRDATNLLVAQHCRAADVPRVVVVVADPRTYDVYPPGIERICATTVLTDAVVAALADGSP